MTKYFLDGNRNILIAYDGDGEMYMCPFVGETHEEADESISEPIEEIKERLGIIPKIQKKNEKRRAPLCINCGERGHFSKTCNRKVSEDSHTVDDDVFNPHDPETIKDIKRRLEEGQTSIKIAIHYKINLLKANEAIDIARKTK